MVIAGIGLVGLAHAIARQICDLVAGSSVAGRLRKTNSNYSSGGNPSDDHLGGRKTGD